jgi:hypothetical protein
MPSDVFRTGNRNLFIALFCRLLIEEMVISSFAPFFVSARTLHLSASGRRQKRLYLVLRFMVCQTILELVVLMEIK